MILEKMRPYRRVGLIFSKIIAGGRSDRRADRPSGTLGRGLWRRSYDDCARAVTAVPDLVDVLPTVQEWAEQGQVRWPSDGFDVPADAEGRAAYERLRAVRRLLREAAYRSQLMAAGQHVPAQARLRDEAVAAARRLLGTTATER
jgi:hypothetical protein